MRKSLKSNRGQMQSHRNVLGFPSCFGSGFVVFQFVWSLKTSWTLLGCLEAPSISWPVNWNIVCFKKSATERRHLRKVCAPKSRINELPRFLSSFPSRNLIRNVRSIKEPGLEKRPKDNTEGVIYVPQYTSNFHRLEDNFFQILI